MEYVAGQFAHLGIVKVTRSRERNGDVLHDPSRLVAHDEDSVAQAGGFADVMGHEQAGDPAERKKRLDS